MEAEHFMEYLEQMRIDKHLTELEEEELMNAYRRKIAEEAYEKQQILRQKQKMLSDVNSVSFSARSFTKRIISFRFSFDCRKCMRIS